MNNLGVFFLSLISSFLKEFLLGKGLSNSKKTFTEMGVMITTNQTPEQLYKEAMQAFCGHGVSEQEAFDALLEQTELIRLLDEIDRSLPAKDVHAVEDKATGLEGGGK